MKSSFFTVALGLSIGAQALPAPNNKASTQSLAQTVATLQTSGAQSLTNNEILSLLNALSSGAATLVQGGAAAGGAAGEGGAAAGEGAKGEAAAGGEAAEGAEGEKENEVDLTGEFGKAVAVEGGDIKQDILFTKSTVGAFEFEFQSAAADSVTVTEKEPGGAAPAGFEFLESKTYAVALAVSKGEGLTLSKIDYIFDVASAGLAGKDITQSKVGRLCQSAGAFVISESLGEVEFEAEENEVTLNLNKAVTAEAEWGIFIPVAAAAASNATAAEGAKGAGEKAAAGAAAGEAKKEAKAKMEGKRSVRLY
ncbi:unnamed protein product [Periconia digitata]|uniref:Accumulation-associated protein n=1 Tax=Periconia digitata TaxID=1303443 RepID=A0A9W4XDR0_9PLEO|nr:unnamed protein product [Periconia digitata]